MDKVAALATGCAVKDNRLIAPIASEEGAQRMNLIETLLSALAA